MRTRDMAPVLIVTGAREGSSLLTRIFHEHGLWVGDCDGMNRYGYHSYENSMLKSFMRSHWPNPTKYPGKPKRGVDLRSFVFGLVPKGERGVFKTFTTVWDVWDDAFPDGNFVLSMRDTNAVVKSHQNKGHGKRSHEYIYALVEWRHEILERISRERGLPIVNMSRVVEGDFSKLEQAMAAVNVPMDIEIVRGCIKPSLWHYKAGGQE